MQITRRSFLTVTAAAPVLCAPAWGRDRAQADHLAEAASYSAERRGVSMVVMQQGRIIFEDYPAPGAPDRAWELASGTKSFCGVIAARLAAQRLLNLNERCAETLSEWRADAGKSAVTIGQLLTLTGGVGSGRIGRPPPYAEAVAAPLASPPGTRFQYGPAPFQVFGEIVRRKLAAASRPIDPLAYLQDEIFTPLGVTPQRWRRGLDGMPHLPSGAALTARDWATFGQFVLEGGRGRLDPQVVAAFWQGTAQNVGYGLTWWLLRPGMKGPGLRAGIETSGAGVAPIEDVRMAAGAGDQRLYLIPARQMIIVRQTNAVLDALRGRGLDYSDVEFLRRALGR